MHAGQAIAVVAKVLGIPKASLGNWVRLAAKGGLGSAGAADKADRVNGDCPAAGGGGAVAHGARHRKKVLVSSPLCKSRRT